MLIVRLARLAALFLITELINDSLDEYDDNEDIATLRSGPLALTLNSAPRLSGLDSEPYALAIWP